MVSRIALLIVKYNRAELSAEERLELTGWINQSAENAELFAELTDPAAMGFHVDKMEGYDEMAVRAKIEAQLPWAFVHQPKVRRIWWRPAVAAAVLVLLGASLYFYLGNQRQLKAPVETTNQIAVQDIAAPKNNRATITLANGQKVFLDSAVNGTLATQGKINIKLITNGQISYVPNSSKSDSLQRREGGVIYNTLTNPRGSKVIDITLADGTQVWLNAESSLKYPVAFAGKERKVEITGEAYFEVAHDQSKPFTVSKGNTSVQVLGTHFNINAYEDENDIKVTLLEGSVKILTKSGPEQILKPNEQAIITNQVDILARPNLEEVMAWKNGLFDFHNADIKAIMQQLSRWYDVQVSYEGKTTDETYNGEIGRTLSLKDVLEGLAFTHVKFRIEEGRKLVILP
jgi:transmembrane sensor